MATTLPTRTADTLGDACVLLGAASIVGSIVTWARAKGSTPDETAHAERFGIFVGLWAPTFLILGNYLKGTGSAHTPVAAGGTAGADAPAVTA